MCLTVARALNDRLIMGDAGVVEHGNGSLEILAFDDAYTGIYKCLTDSYDAFTQTTFNLTLLEGCSLGIVNFLKYHDLVLQTKTAPFDIRTSNVSYS